MNVTFDFQELRAHAKEFCPIHNISSTYQDFCSNVNDKLKTIDYSQHHILASIFGKMNILVWFHTFCLREVVKNYDRPLGFIGWIVTPLSKIVFNVVLYNIDYTAMFSVINEFFTISISARSDRFEGEIPLSNFLGIEYFFRYRSGMLNSNTDNSKFHLIRSLFEIFARFLSFHV